MEHENLTRKSVSHGGDGSEMTGKVAGFQPPPFQLQASEGGSGEGFGEAPIQRALLVHGSDPATKGNATSMAVSGTYGAIIADIGGMVAQVKNKDQSLHIVAHVEGNDLEGYPIAKLASDILELNLFNRKPPLKDIHLHGCYSAGAAQALKNALDAKGVPYCRVHGTNGLNVTIGGRSMVLKAHAFSDGGPEANWKAYEAQLEGGKINEDKFMRLIEGKIAGPEEGWTSY